ncbi:hypothetical protein CORT_0A08140 [Candida orthopsilosis Co 90-125]|uniref:Protein kinase domain-containing protein n=1 Tax=Candida orthopsilosis (strain 90-125) TaxID=1136231 RepID=H8WY84_CANO9|nr:hypothetical protein CORT_0A08140 [Candida orthopsilosis Co 90-125]CCG21199.1 hypothetical protein CORT_0A08140 [Candida orthopsilosis Co 90-125]
MGATIDVMPSSSLDDTLKTTSIDGAPLNDPVGGVHTPTSATSAFFTFDATLNELYPNLPPNYKLISILGEGAFSTVYKALDARQNKPVAIKIISKAHLTSKQFHNIKNEIKIMKRTHHPNVLQLYDSFDTPDHCFLILEYCNGGEIFNKIIEYTYFSEPLSRHVFKQLLSAIDNLHKLNIVHRDIKPENLLFKKIPFFPRSVEESEKHARKSDDDCKVDEGEFKLNVGGGTIGVIKLADFGLAKQLIDEDDNSRVPMKTPCGTAGYTAPEVITCNTRSEGFYSQKTRNQYSKAVDIWSLGCFLYTILCGFPPFYDDDANDVTMKILRGDFVFLQPWWDEISDDAKDLITKMLEVNPEKRITIEEIWHHPWVMQGQRQSVTSNGDLVEASHYFEQNYEVDHVEDIGNDELTIPMSNQPILSPRAHAIKVVFDNPAMLGSFTDVSTQFIENIDEEDEVDEEDDDDEEDEVDKHKVLHKTKEYIPTPMPKELNFKNVFNVDKSQLDVSGDDSDEDGEVSEDEVSELEDDLASLQLTPKLMTRSRNGSQAQCQYTGKILDEEMDDYSNSDNEISEWTRSSSIISGIESFKLTLTDSNLLARRKSSRKASAVTTVSMDKRQEQQV